MIGATLLWLTPLFANLPHATLAAIIIAAIVGIIEDTQRAGKIPGISAPNAERAQFWIDRGCLFVTAGDDGSMMLETAQQTLKYLGR